MTGTTDMAGRPIFREAVNRIQAMGGEQWVLDNVMGGMTLSQVSRLADVSRGMMYLWMHQDAKRWEAYQKAREIGAYAMAEEALEIVDNSSPERISIDRERARMRQWLAERANKKDFGRPQDTAPAQISIGQLHLTALQAAALPPAPLVEEGEFEIVKEPILEDLL